MSIIEPGDFMVVEFLGFNCVEVVPGSWISKSEKGTFVYWPTSQAGARARRCELPDPTKWKKYEIRVFCSTDNYERAKLLAKRAEDTSHPETEEEGETARKRKKPLRFQDENPDSEDSGDNGDTEEQPAISKNQSPMLQTSKSLELPRPPRSIFPTARTCTTIPSTDLAPRISTGSPSVSTTVTQSCGVQNTPKEKASTNASPRFDDAFYDEMPTFEVPPDSRESTPRQRQSGIQGRSGPRDHGFQVNVLMRLRNIEQKLEEQVSVLRSAFSSMALNVEGEEDVLPEPLDGEEELLQLEERLKDKAYKKKMILYLSSLGGHDIGDSIRRMLRKVGTNKLWSGYSYKGRKNLKKPFQSLKLSNVIKRAYLRSNPKAQEKEIEDKISATLKGAPFKKGGVLPVANPRVTAAREESSEDETENVM